MRYQALGKSGLQVSSLCLGCMSFGKIDRGAHTWTLDLCGTREMVTRAVELGINFFDTANVYSAGSSEEILGQVLGEIGRRDEFVVATKCHGPWGAGPNQGGLSRKAIFQAIDDSLARLRMDYVDLYQIHRLDKGTPVEETLEALDDLVKAGKVRYIGASSMPAWRFMQAISIQDANGWARFISMQNHLNLLYREEEREMMPLCRDQGVGMIPWSPMARGRLARPWGAVTERLETDKFGAGLYAKEEASNHAIIDAVGVVADQRGVNRARVALAWVAQQDGVVAPIVGATRVEQLNDAAAAVDLVLSPDECALLEAPYSPRDVSGH